MTSSRDQDHPLLPHTSLNPTGSPTIILLHGLLSTPPEYTHVTPHLTTQDHNYHILLPTLPSHGQATHSTYGPFTLPNASAHIARLIQQKANNGTAHVVGLSAGGMAALHLAQNHPELVLSLFVMGVGGVKGRKLVRVLGPYVLFAGAGLGYYSPGWLHRWGMRRMGVENVPGACGRSRGGMLGWGC
jgi:pimeloyl-ACP methyl ester carboxylesterase